MPCSLARHITLIALLSLLSLLAAGCSDDSSSSSISILPPDGTAAYVAFVPSEGQLPLPNNLVFYSSDNGLLNIPDDISGEIRNSVEALNNLDGWSSNAPFVVEIIYPGEDSHGASESGDAIVEMFARSADRGLLAASLERPDAVQLFDVTLDADQLVSAINHRLIRGEDFTTTRSADGQDLLVQPLKPFTGGNSYLLVLTRELEDARGMQLVPPPEYMTLRLPLQYGELPDEAGAAQKMINSQEQALADYGIEQEAVIYSASFSVQTMGQSLAAIRDQALSGNVRLNGLDSILDAGQLSLAGSEALSSYLSSLGIDSQQEEFAPLLNAASAFRAGEVTLSLPYFLPLPQGRDNSAPWYCSPDQFQTTLSCPDLDGSWQTGADHLPQVLTPDYQADVLITLPVAPAAGPWPVVIFSHGIGFSKESGLLLAGTMAQAGIATLAIDHPLHGSRGIDLDGDGLPELSASSDTTVFNSISNPLTMRDNLRQSVSDLLALRLALNAHPDLFDLSQVTFAGQSLGAIVGSVFASLALDADSSHYDLAAVALNVPGQGLAGILGYAPAFADEASEIPPEHLPTLVFAVQTVIDSVDPVNYQAALRDSAVPIYLAAVEDDSTIPNRLSHMPLVGTEPMIDGLGLDRLYGEGSYSTGHYAVIFSSASHSSLLNPQGNPVATQEMQAQLASFISSAGNQLLISNGSLLQSPALASSGQ